MNISRAHYDAFVTQSPQRSIYCQSWWLDTVAPRRWDAVAVVKGETIRALLPFQRGRTKGMQTLQHPLLCPMLGPLLPPSKAKYNSQLAEQKELISGLIDQLAEFDSLRIALHHSLQNWLPFYWKHFEQTTIYTYTISDTSNLETVWSGFRDKQRTEIRKAQKELTIRDDLPLSEFWRLYGLSFEHHSMERPVSFEMLSQVVKTCAERDCIKIHYACDKDGKAHAACIWIWDDRFLYYLLGGADPTIRLSGAHPLVIWEGLQLASKKGLQFDFVGSMSESIERFFRAFNARQTPILVVKRVSARFKCYSSASAIYRKLKNRITDEL